MMAGLYSHLVQYKTTTLAQNDMPVALRQITDLRKAMAPMEEQMDEADIWLGIRGLGVSKCCRRCDDVKYIMISTDMKEVHSQANDNVW